MHSTGVQAGPRARLGKIDMVKETHTPPPTQPGAQSIPDRPLPAHCVPTNRLPHPSLDHDAQFFFLANVNYTQCEYAPTI